ncbi:Gp138 family membrane-puncturing spike protein [Bacillus atrophaeus]|uniref:Gp138 family membrane-puncturing spike protein n=1 Tax=Bacillus subtilis group TaxID=653685 RepID=UPI00227EEDE2|nr:MULTISPECIES: Gp138 family membrane-puncturing spike protein [Bacillus subtilis group]MCY7919565.1 hypothetical protein [Bacillus vallismortis]MCY8813684.1 hypothetical protein [Bacillus atrophaeus]MCY8820243.1 hypothetical protein [Bacillus atrophaeus]MCY8828633.1 hypothetical protein [Bacillus atrophaeus]MCY8832720.1 hypothetical protein [Bacillus atrophaeus]
MTKQTNFYDALIKNIKHSIHTLAPARIVSYDAGTKTASVKPLFMTADEDTLYEQPLIEAVPVLKHAQADIVPGGVVFVAFAERALDNLSGNKPFDPDSSRTHDMTDAVVMGVWDG